MTRLHTYDVSEIFYSIQGEGARTGTAAVFVRFAGCNLHCTRDKVGFDCDTEHDSREVLTAEEIVDRYLGIVGGARPRMVATGGEPFLQIGKDNSNFITVLRANEIRLSVETNGTLGPYYWPDWVTVSPKPGTEILQDQADEVKIVLAEGQEPPPLVWTRNRSVSYYFGCGSGGKGFFTVRGIRTRRPMLSPAFKGNEMDEAAVAWCVAKVKEDPRWRLSLQMHKMIGVR